MIATTLPNVRSLPLDLHLDSNLSSITHRIDAAYEVLWMLPKPIPKLLYHPDKGIKPPFYKTVTHSSERIALCRP